MLHSPHYPAWGGYGRHLFVLGHPEGHVVVWQRTHAALCAQLARAWGNASFGGFEPRATVELAAERHEMGMDGERPELNPATGLPKDYDELSHAQHLPVQFDGPEQLAAIDPYAGLLASLHSASFYRRTSLTALLTRDGRIERRALRRAARLQQRLREQLRPDDAQVERNRRLVRYWDGLSHDLLARRWPRVRSGVPASNGELRDVVLATKGSDPNVVLSLDPWPFRDEREQFCVTGRLLRERYTSQADLEAAFDAAEEVGLAFVVEAT
jgi:hypothetical protein